MKALSTWTLDEAVTAVRILEKQASAVGWHLGITGGVLYKGESKKDLDLVAYPHRTTKCCSVEDLQQALTHLSTWEQMPHDKYGDDKMVYGCSAPSGKTIDIFFLR